MGVPFGAKNRIYPDREPKKVPRQVHMKLPPEKIECKLTHNDICMLCLEKCQEVALVKVKEHFKCPACSYRCPCK